MVKFGEIAREVRTVWKEMREGVPVVGLEHIVPGEMELKKYDLPEENTFTKKFCKGQVLFGRRRAYQKKATVATFDGICSGDITVIEPIPGMVVPELLPFIVANDRFFDHAIQGSAGSLSPRVKWEHMANYEFELPTLEEQKVLANKLWAAYHLKEAYQRLLNATDEMVKSQFLEMCSDIVSRKALSELLSENFPGEWGSEPTDYDRTKVIRTTNFTNEGKLDLTDVVERSIDAKKVAKKQLKKGDIILERSGGTKENPVGRVVIFEEDGKYLFNNFTQLLRPNENVNSTYLFYYLFTSYNVNKASMRAMASQTTGIQNLNMSDYLAKTIELPSNNVQNHFETIYRQADKSKFELRKAIDAIDEVIKSLING